MKGAFLIANDSQLYSKVRVALARLGAKSATDDGVVQLTDEMGNLFTVFRDLSPAADAEWRAEPLTGAGGVSIPDLDAATACWIECRSERAFAALAQHVAAELREEAWVIDSDGVVWPAAEVDPDRVRL